MLLSVLDAETRRYFVRTKEDLPSLFDGNVETAHPMYSDGKVACPGFGQGKTEARFPFSLQGGDLLLGLM